MDQGKEVEENNRMEKTRELFKKIRDTKGTFHVKMGSIKDRNGMDLTEAAAIKKRWQENPEELYKKDLKVKIAQSCPTLCDPMDYTSPWNSPDQNTGVGSLSLLQGIFLTQGSNPGLPHCKRILYQLSQKESPYKKDHNEPDNHCGVITHLEPDILK